MCSTMHYSICMFSGLKKNYMSHHTTVCKWFFKHRKAKNYMLFGQSKNIKMCPICVLYTAVVVCYLDRGIQMCPTTHYSSYMLFGQKKWTIYAPLRTTVDVCYSDEKKRERENAENDTCPKTCYSRCVI